MKKNIVWILFFGFLLACSSGDDTPSNDNNDDNGQNNNDNNDNGTSFDRGALLVNWADNIIVPAFENFKAAADGLNQSANAFSQDASSSNLEALRSSWYDALVAFQSVSIFEIGEAESIRFRNRVNIYPADPSQIEENIQSASYDLALPSNNDAQGFQALDYLLYASAADNDAILNRFQTEADLMDYLQDLTQTISDLTAAVLADWQGGFRDSFVANTASSASGSVDKLTNDFMFYYEKALRAGKVGIPAGVFSTEPLPDRVEVYYQRDSSRELALIALQEAQDFFNGRAFNGNATGSSLKSYLDFLNTIKNGEDLSQLINDQFDIARLSIEGLNTNFVQQIQDDNAKMLGAYDELQRNVVLMKVDMMQALDISIDYVDADGD
ncbi:imelysin family protein [Aureitalea marina]|uniref:Peptidase M75 superfamily protein n=1 Tax=Aureitalea marina TaxID=930804 RepID=A0A2S7KMX3_9FLAO|nr:imelysin family protein [Aureitalea marina]PQB03940.1 peptidase M75 superfamily protein [Aureitalea marina]